MRLRKQDVNGDMVFGGGQAAFWVDQPEGVAQLIGTRLKLLLAEFFLDTSDGTPWTTEVIGVRTQSTRDAAIKNRILGTQGVNSILSYSSSVSGRAFSAQAKVDTIYGEVAIATTATPSSDNSGQLDFRFAINSQMLPAL